MSPVRAGGAGRYSLSATLVLCLALGCSPRLPAAYVSSTENARAAYEHGEYASAAQRWAEAEALAPSARERDECRYRRAMSLERAGKHEQARAVLSTLSAGRGDRQARARFDHATSLIQSEKEQAGYAELLAAVLEFPDSGLAPKAMRQLLVREEEQRGVRAALQLISDVEHKVHGSDLNQVLGYERAKLTEQAYGPSRALPEYRALILRFPYPEGSYWDESILRSAELERQLGRPQQAIDWLHFLLAHREQSNFMGSYERHYAKAQFMVAEIARDDLHDWQRARADFRLVFERFPTSLLGDDALLEAARLSHEHGEAAAACDDVARLKKAFADSRHVDVATSLCTAAQ